MSYQPRRIVDVVDDPSEGDEVSTAEQNPRRSADSLFEKLLHRADIVLAAVTVVATSAAVVLGSTVATAEAASPPVVGASAGTLVSGELSMDAPILLSSRSDGTAVALSRRYSTDLLTVRSGPSSDSKSIGQLGIAAEVEVTTEVSGDYRKVVFGDDFGWVLAKSLTKSESDAAPRGTSMKPCSRGSAVENHLRKGTIFIYRSVCPLFPEVNSYGGYRSSGREFHKNGRALDIMLTPTKESALGWRIAKYLTSHADTFNIDHVIFEQHIWTPSSPTWKLMEDRGSITENHFNHVHVAIKS